MCRNCVALRARHFKIVHGEADCKFVGPPVKTPTRFVVYKKESSIPQEVMYLSTSSGTSTCAAGKWLAQKASDDDYVDAQLGYFELKGGTGGDSFFAYRKCRDAPTHCAWKNDKTWLVVWNIFYFPIYWVSNHPN